MTSRSLSAARALGLYLLLSCSRVPLALAHGQEVNERHGNMNETMRTDLEPAVLSYFSLSGEVGLIYTHIALMTIAWVVVLPVGTSSRTLTLFKLLSVSFAHK